MFNASEIAVLESLAHGGKTAKDLLSPAELSMIAGVTLEPGSVLKAFNYLKHEKYVVHDLQSDKFILSGPGKAALEKADYQVLTRQNFQLLEGQLKAANDLSESLIKELHDQAERSDKQRKEAEKKADSDKWIQLFLGWLLGIASTVIAQVILKWIG